MAELEDSSSSSSSRARKVLMGTCGWSDHTLLKCGRFYPASVRSAEDRLRHYSTHFPCVEVDTSTYAIPSTSSIKGWLRCVPKGFLFHFKAFGLFCSKSCPITALPVHIRTKVSVACPGKDYIHLSAMSESLRDELWKFFNTALCIVHGAGNLGVVVFQFHLTFKPTKENQAHVEWCRQNLDPCYSMAAEFRCRDWFNGQHLVSTTKWLEKCCIALVAADELHHETFQKDRQQTGLPKGQERVTLPVAWALTQPDFMYIRVHRREGPQRLLSESELVFWVTRLKEDLSQELKGPVYFMWGTDWEDQPIINAKCLNDRLAGIAFDWKVAQQLTDSKRGLETYFGDKAKNKNALKCASMPRESMSLCQSQESNVWEDEVIELCPERRNEYGLFLAGSSVEMETPSALSVSSSKKKDGQNVPALLGIRRTTKSTDKQKTNASLKKNFSPITTYFRKSSGQ